MKCTAYNNEFERVDGAPVGSEKKIVAWMKKRFPGLRKKPEPQENGASIFFHEGDVVAYDTDNDGEVYMVELTEEDQDGCEEDEGADDASDDFFDDSDNNQTEDAESLKTDVKIGRKTYSAYLSKTEGGWSLDKIDPLPSGTVALPAEIDGRTIVSFGKCLFRDAPKLATVKMPDTITAILGQGFYGAFSGCATLKKIVFSQNIKVIGSGTFADCRSLESVELPDSIEQLGSFVFAGCRSLKSIKMPKGLFAIEASLFEGCSSLSRVEFAEGLKTVSQDVFKDCEALEEVVFPSSFNPDDLWSNMFGNCSRLKRVIFKVAQPDDFDHGEFVSYNFEDSPGVKVTFSKEE